jgi:hypothetical protein
MPARLWDMEDIMDEVVTYLKDATKGINAAITAINSAKSAKDTAAGRTVMTLTKFTNANTPQVETLTEGQNLFFFMVEEITNCDPCLVVRIPVWGEEEGASNTTLNFEIIIEDNADGTDPKRKLLRYVTVLRSVLADYLNDATMFTASKLLNVEPNFQQVLVENETRSYYSAGVAIEIDFA